MIVQRWLKSVTKPPAPLLADPRYQDFFALLGTVDNLRGVVSVFRKLEPDSFLLRNIDLFESMAAERKPFWEVCCVLSAYARVFQPVSYLEIGVRRGRSMAQVATAAPEVRLLGFDMWITNYSGVDNPGPEHVEAELRRLGFEGELTLIEGNSHETLKPYLDQRPGATWDMITVDGDHTGRGAKQDLLEVVDRVAPGGLLLFDDISHKRHTLHRVWKWFRKTYQDRFYFMENWRDLHGTAFAIRKGA